MSNSCILLPRGQKDHQEVTSPYLGDQKMAVAQSQPSKLDGLPSKKTNIDTDKPP